MRTKRILLTTLAVTTLLPAMAANYGCDSLEYSPTWTAESITLSFSKSTYYLTNANFTSPQTDTYKCTFDWQPQPNSGKNVQLYLSNSVSTSTTNISNGTFLKLRMASGGNLSLHDSPSGSAQVSATTTDGGMLHVEVYSSKEDGYTLARLIDSTSGDTVEYKRDGHYLLRSLLSYCTGKQAITNVTMYASETKQQKQTWESDTWQTASQNRGLFACLNEDGNTFVSWRARATDTDLTVYTLYRNDDMVGQFTTKTNVTLDGGATTDTYRLEVANDGVTDETQTMTANVSETSYFTIKLGTEPVYLYEGDYSNGKLWFCSASNYNVNKMQDCTETNFYVPNDCSAFDMDGDGEQEIIMKWDPSTSQDNGYASWTANTYIDCYKLNGQQLWRINMGNNIRSGPHYTQMLCYDFDGDGKGEMMLITAPGTKDAAGHYVAGYKTDSIGKVKDYSRGTYNNSGHIVYAPEYVTVFDGTTGLELASTPYYPSYDDGCGSHGWDEPSSSANLWNKGTRFRAAVAMLDGVHPSAVFNRGYYTQSFYTAYNWNGKQLYELWRHDTSTTDTEGSLYGQGSHSLAVADVDGDGCDEILSGASAVDHDGKVLWSTGFGHGDATHLGDFDPEHEGLEFFYINEEKSRNTLWSAALLDAKTGAVLSGRAYDGSDTGRGVIGDFDASHRGSEYCTQVAGGYTDSYLTDAKGNTFAKWYGEGSLATDYVSPDGIANDKASNPNFRIYWDGDLQDEWLDNRHVDHWDATAQTWQRVYTFAYNGKSACAINGTKENPCLQCDILGDWREEAVFYVEDGTDANGRKQYYLVVYTTTIPTEYKLPWLRDDRVYDMAIAWQNVGYNQPPHLSYSPAERFADDATTGIRSVVATPSQSLYNAAGLRLSAPQRGLNIIDGKKVIRW